MKRISKALFDKMQKTAIRMSNVKAEFDRAIERKYGTHYTDHNLDEIIDAIDYGGGGLTFDRFTELMNELIEDEDFEDEYN